MARRISAAPAYESLPEAIHRDAESSDVLQEIELSIEVVTPILGGAHKLRHVDEIDVIRVSSVRGQLRFWWRALNAQRYKTSTDLHSAECELWGGAASEGGPGRSKVEVRVVVEKPGSVTRDGDDIRLGDADSYALWPARAERRGDRPPAKRRLPGTRFRLLVRVPTDLEPEVSNAVRAWLVFGGYGSRTRRGLGSLSVVGTSADRELWLPQASSIDGFRSLFQSQSDVFEAVGDSQSHQTPVLAGAALVVGREHGRADTAWHEALHWLRDFRQGVDTGAREPSTRGDKRASISNWPEPDKVRHHSRSRNGQPWAHEPRHNTTPAWPRAGFGLPIVGQFQGMSRDNQRWNEPEGFQLRWRSPAEAGGKVEEHTRLASPLIVKAMPLASGKFVPCALWLNRSMPEGAEVGLYRGNSIDDRTVAPFDRLTAAGDAPCFAALEGKNSLRDAFLGWLHGQDGVVVVAP